MIASTSPYPSLPAGQRPLAALALLALLLLGVALFDWHGGYSPRALALVLAAFAALVLGLSGRGGTVRESVVFVAGLAGLVVSFALIGGSVPAFGLLPGSRVEDFTGLVVVAALAVGAAVCGGDRIGRWAAWWAIGLFCLAAVWVLHASPWPQIDVFTIHRDGAAGLLAGKNPYAMRFDQVYSPELALELYGTEVLDAEGRLDAGYTYLPLTLLVAVPSALLGDVRYGNVLAVAAVAAVLLSVGGGSWGRLVAMTFLFSPMNFFTIEMAWTEVWSAALFAAFVGTLTAPGGTWRYRAAPWIFGLLLVSKQHLPLLLLPVAWTCLPATRRPSFLWRMLVAGTVVTLPLILWNLAAFWQSAAVLLASAPFRTDGLTIGAALHSGGITLPTPAWWVLGLGAFGATLVGLRQCGGAPVVRFAVGSGLAMGIFFVLSKQAFCNYYFLVIACVATGLAAAGRRDVPPLRMGASSN